MSLLPFLAPIFSRVGGLLKYQAYPEAPTVETAYDLTAEFGAIATAQATAEDAAAAAAAANSNASSAFPTTCAFHADELIYTNGTRGIALTTVVKYGYSVFTTTDLAACRYFVDLRAGTWDFWFSALKRNDCGRVAIAVDSIILDNPLDLYAAVADGVFEKKYTGITIPSNGRYQVGFTVGGKNISSSGFSFVPLKFWGNRTGA